MPIESDGKTYKTVDEMFDKMESDFKKEHPILNWIDEKIPPIQWMPYRTSYSLTHPWLIVQELGFQVKWGFQRLFYEYDERVIWSIDSHLARMIPVWVEKLIKDKHGVPMMMFEDDEVNQENGHIDDEIRDLRRKEYDEILQKIANGFRAYLKMDEVKWKSDEYNQLEKEYEQGWYLLKTYFGTLWD